MVSIKTERLRELAEILNREAVHYDHRFRALEESISWVRRQEFNEANEIHRVLMREYDELRQQKKAMMLLAEAILRICDKYDKTEQKIVDSGETCEKLIVRADWINLEHMRRLLVKVGLDMTDQ